MIGEPIQSGQPPIISQEISHAMEQTLMDKWEKITQLSKDRLQILGIDQGVIRIKVDLSVKEGDSPENDTLQKETLKLKMDSIKNFINHLNNEKVSIVLKELDLSRNNVTGKDLITYGKGINEKLEVLNLSETKTDSHMIKSIKSNFPKLKEIYLDKCPHFAEFPTIHRNFLPKSLKILSVRQTPIKKLPHMHSKFPDLKILSELKNVKSNEAFPMKKRYQNEIKEWLKDEILPKYPSIEDFLKAYSFYPHDLEHFNKAVEHSHCIKELFLLLKLDSETLDFVLKIPEDNIGNNWQNYTVRIKGFKKIYNNSNQERYGKWMHHTIKTAALTTPEKNWDFDQLMNFLAMRRGILATLSNQRGSRMVGVKRTGDMFTSCEDSYKNIIETIRSAPEGKYKFDDEDQKFKYIYVKAFEDQPIPFSVITIAKPPHYGAVEHPPPEVATAAMEYVKSTLYPHALEEKDPEKLMEDLGRIFWWICQAKPWEYGDPSIAESLVRTIWTMKFPDKENPPWNEGIIPWEQVIIETNVDEFAKNFHSLFEWKGKQLPPKGESF